MRTKKKQRCIRSNKSVHKRIKNKGKNNRTVKKRNNVKKRNTTIRKEHNSITHSGGTYKLIGGGGEIDIIRLFAGGSDDNYTTGECIFTKLFTKLLENLKDTYIEFISKIINIYKQSSQEQSSQDKVELIKKYKIFDLVSKFIADKGGIDAIDNWFNSTTLLDIMTELKDIMKELDNRKYKYGKSGFFQFNEKTNKFEKEELDFQTVIDINIICKNIKHKAKKLVKFYGGKNMFTRRLVNDRIFQLKGKLKE